MAAIIPAAVAGGYAGTWAAGTLGIGTFGTLLLGAAGAATLSRPIESAFEAADTFGTARSLGMSNEEANKAANAVFKKNLTLVGADALEFATAFLPVKGVGATLGKLLVSGAMKAGEEVYQYKIQQEALGKEFNTNEAKEAGALGAMLGLGLKEWWWSTYLM